jgi:hypothetical protein
MSSTAFFDITQDALAAVVPVDAVADETVVSAMTKLSAARERAVYQPVDGWLT